MTTITRPPCSCVSCDFCRGNGTVRVPDRSSPDGYELEQCDECGGSGIVEECFSCQDQRELDDDSEGQR